MLPEAGKASPCSHPQIQLKFQVAISRFDWDPLALLQSLHPGYDFLRPISLRHVGAIGGVSVQMCRRLDEGFEGGEIRRGEDELRWLHGILTRRGATKAMKSVVVRDGPKYL
ncbi:hypothetical protein KSP40_PGU010495 [Platanthera guangdongensis]|uniref:Uncharacterized protein n=1 Tax=Platanthera guangdongensis TaxID=2320717 RepID=A0ABR2M2C0_9ASPA